MLNVKGVKLIDVKRDGHIFDVSLDMCPTMHPTLQSIIYSIFVVFVNWYLPSPCTHSFINEWSPYSFVTTMASNHTIELVNTATGTCHSTLASAMYVSKVIARQHINAQV